jgi:hypothetical protein
MRGGGGRTKAVCLVGVRILSRLRSGGGTVAAAVAAGALAALSVSAPVAGATTPIGSNANFGGYVGLLSTKGTTSTTLVSTFKLPTLNCSATPSSASYLYEEAGLGGGIDTGAKSWSLAIAAVAEKCSEGAPAYAGAVLAGSTFDLLPVEPAAGDTIQVSATESSAGSTVTLTDVTKDKSLTESGAGAAVQIYAAGIVPTKGVVPTFTSVPFTASLNGADLTSGAAGYNLTSGATTLVSTSVFSGTPSAWTETFEANS